jgi:hypothetical protein
MLPAPAVPRDAVMPGDLQTVLIVVLGAFAVVAIAGMLADAGRRRDPLAVHILLGGVLAILYEPLGDILVLAYYPEIGQHTWITLFGRDVPVFIGLTYVWFMGPFILAFARLAERGFTRRTWWSLWAGAVLFGAAFEIIPLRFGASWIYYGKPAFMVGDVPLHVAFADATFLFVMAAGVYAIRRWLPAGRQWLVIPAVPVLLVAGHASAALPAAAALYSTTNRTWIVLGALGSIAVAALISFALSSVFVGERRRAGGEGAPAAPVDPAADPRLPSVTTA